MKKLKLVNESLNENMSYTSFLGKEVSHDEALQKSIRDSITHVITDERKISEKAFEAYDSVMEEVKNMCLANPEIYKQAEEYYKEGKRLSLLAEEVYEKYFKSNENS